MALIDDAIARAATDHAGQNDMAAGGSGSPMIYHLIRVAAAVWDETVTEAMAAVAVMQRLYSDTATTNEDLLVAGFSTQVRAGIVILTQGEEKNFRQYIKRIGGEDPDAIRIKIVELRKAIQNLGLNTLDRTRYQTALRYLQEQLSIETV